MPNRPIDAEMWDDEKFRIEKWDDEKTKYKIEALRLQAEIMWGRPVAVKEIVSLAIDHSYSALSLQFINDLYERQE